MLNHLDFSDMKKPTVQNSIFDSLCNWDSLRFILIRLQQSNYLNIRQECTQIKHTWDFAKYMAHIIFNQQPNETVINTSQKTGVSPNMMATKQTPKNSGGELS